MLLELLCVVVFARQSLGDTCEGVQTFEKFASQNLDEVKFAPSGVIYQVVNEGLTADCVRLCNKQPKCGGFKMDYGNYTCWAFEGAPESSRNFYQPSDFVTSASVNFFEKACYKGLNASDLQLICGKDRLWAVEVVNNAFLEGFDEMALANLSRAECSAACLVEKSFLCRSADYEPSTSLCRLSRESRWTQKQAFREVRDSARSYLENQCLHPGECTRDARKGRRRKNESKKAFLAAVRAVQRFCAAYDSSFSTPQLWDAEKSCESA